MYGFESRMVVHQDQRVLVTPVHGSYKGFCNICVYQSSRMRRLVKLRVVRLTSRVGLDAGITTVKTSVGECRRSVGGDCR
eukprot:466513-Pleurochrysis_carterae.AAC.1